MRPIMLDLHGFASFRDEAHVDFGDADFFALAALEHGLQYSRMHSEWAAGVIDGLDRRTKR